MCAGSRAPGANLGRFNARLCKQRQRNASCGAKKRCGKLTELWKNQRTVFPQLLEPSVHSFPQRRLLLEFRTQHFFYSFSLLSTRTKVFGDGTVWKNNALPQELTG